MNLIIKTKHILMLLQWISWILFIGLCIDTGGIIFNTIYNLIRQPEQLDSYWQGAEYLSSLYLMDKVNYVVVAGLMGLVGIFKSLMFYLIVKVFSEKKLKLSEPFNTDLRKFIVNTAYLCLGIGISSIIVNDYTQWLQTLGAMKVDMESLKLGGADVWLFMSVILMLIVQLVKRGIEIQKENGLTI